MSLVDRFKTKSSKERKRKNNNIISALLDDLTTLEINTIIKDSMSAADPPESTGLLLKGLLDRYKARLNSILADHGLFGFFNQEECITFDKLLITIKEILTHLEKEKIRLDDGDYNRVMRMESFCRFIDYRSKTELKVSKIEKLTVTTKDESNKEIIVPLNLFKLNKEDYSEDKFKIFTRDLVKIKRYFDLGNEEIIMQTRFGIDGDVVTRIGRDFSKNPKQLIIDIHDKHTNLSINYWKSLVSLVKEIVESIIR